MHNASILQNKYCTVEAYPEEISWEMLSFVYHLPREEKAQSKNQPWPEEGCQGMGHPVPIQTPQGWLGLSLRRQTVPKTKWGWEQNDRISSCWDCSSWVFTFSPKQNTTSVSEVGKQWMSPASAPKARQN